MIEWRRCVCVASSLIRRMRQSPTCVYRSVLPVSTFNTLPKEAPRGFKRDLHTLPPPRPTTTTTTTTSLPWITRGVGVLHRRHLWGWLNTIFNKVDESRVKDVGPDRACAEWLLRCGAVVRWLDRDQWTKDYNSLPASGGRALKIEEIDATDSAIMHIGFPHFKGCKYVRRIIFHRSTYLDDEALSQLPILANSLKQLQISSCGNITTKGLKYLHQLKNLDHLLLYDLPEIEDKDAVVRELEAALPSCTVVFPYAQAKDDPTLKDKDPPT